MSILDSQTDVDAAKAARRLVQRREANRRWRERHPEELREHRRKDALKRSAAKVEASRAWRIANPDRASAHWAARDANRRARLYPPFVPLGFEDVLTLWLRQPSCVRCGQGRGLDHVVALRDGGANALENLQNLCQTCNDEKEIAARPMRKEIEP